MVDLHVGKTKFAQLINVADTCPYDVILGTDGLRKLDVLKMNWRTHQAEMQMDQTPKQDDPTTPTFTVSPRRGNGSHEV